MGYQEERRFCDTMSCMRVFGANVLIAFGMCVPAFGQGATLTVSGDVTSRLSLKAQDLAAMPRQSVTAHDEDGTAAHYEGVALREILKRAGAPSDKQMRGKALASYFVAKASDGYQVVFTLAELEPELGNEQILVADTRDGKPLSDHLGPFRIVCPNDKAGARSVRMLQAIEVVLLQKGAQPSLPK
jgi:DMSO/TMAO reductase YedYZ molybdopterin-dependent catalytic subunit